MYQNNVEFFYPIDFETNEIWKQITFAAPAMVRILSNIQYS